MIRSELSWKLKDYEQAGVEPPARIVSTPDLTEGEMMTADEVEEFIKDSIATLRILSDKGSPRFEAVADMYRADLAYLVNVGSLDQEDYNDLVHPDNLRF